MRYNVDKKNFRSLLRQRPGLIKKVTNLDEDTAAFLVKEAKRCFEYLSWELKQSLKVIKAYMYTKKDNDIYSHYRNSWSHKNIPFSVLDKLTPTERKKYIKKALESYDDAWDNLPEKTYEEWLYAIEFKAHKVVPYIPEEYQTNPTVWEAYAKNIEENTGTIPSHQIPEKFWENPQAETHILNFIRNYSYRVLQTVPPQRVTKDMLLAAFQSVKADDEFSLDSDYAHIPLSSWDKNVVALALAANYDNISIIPPSLLTEDDAIEAAKKSVHISCIPVQVLTRKVKVHIAAYRPSSYSTAGQFRTQCDSEEFPELKDTQFLCDVVKENPRHGAKTIKEFITPENRMPLLKESPYIIKYIPKLEQTDEMIDTLINNAEAEDLDTLDSYINLGKIKKKHAPLLVGCESALLVGTIEKKLKSVKKRMSRAEITSMKTVATLSTVEINMAPADFAKIRTDL